MGTVNVTLGDATQLNLILGQQNENEVTEVVFDYSAWKTAYGSGTLSLSVQRPGDQQPYAVVMTTSGDTATWEVSSLDTAYNGTGEIQLTYTVGTLVKKSVVYMFTVYGSIGANGEYPSPGQTWQEEIEDELADVKEDLQDIQAEIEGGGSGMSEDFKQALHDILEKVAYIDENGQDYLDALDSAMWPPATLVSISAVYTQSGTVYDNDTLDSLKTDLVVTAHYDDSSSQIVTTYTLSGSLTTGTSTITVAYGGKTTTFNVTVTHATAQYSITNTLAHVTNSNNATVINEQASYSATLSPESGYVISSVAITMGGNDITSTAYNSSTKAITIASVTGNIVITATGAESAYQIYDTIMANSTYTYNAENSIFFPDYVALGDVASVDELQVEFEMQLQTTPTSTKCLIGAKSSNSSSDINGLQFNLSANGLGLYAHGVNVGSAYGDFSSVLDLGRHIIKYENTNVSPSTYKCDNESKTIEWTTNGGCTVKLGLSFCNANGTPNQVSANSLVKIGYVKLWDKDGNLLNHFVPAVRKSDNFVGMYDENNDVFITATTNTRYVCGTWT